MEYCKTCKNRNDKTVCELCGLDLSHYEAIPTIKDSGARKLYETGAVRDIQEGKGACYLMPLNVVAHLANSAEIATVEMFRQTGNIDCLYECLNCFSDRWFDSVEEMLLEVSKHFEAGAKKYGPNNWQKGIPIHSYIDSALRHYLKFCAGITDEPHGIAFVWNILCAIWTMENKPEMNDFTVRKDVQ